MIKRLWQFSIILFILLIGFLGAAGCAPIPIKSQKIEDTQAYISQEILDPLVANGTIRKDVLSRFGEPTCELPDVRGFGYLRSVSFDGWIWSLVFFVPLPPFGKDPITDCEFVGFWFDNSDRLIKSETRVFHGLMFMDEEGHFLAADRLTTADPQYLHYYSELKEWLWKKAPY